jgi:Transposase DDE domain
MTPAAAAILEGMPDPRDLRRAEHDGITYISAGSALLSCYPSAGLTMRNVAVAVLRQLGFGGRAVAAVMGLTENYVATLHNRALREGLPGIVRDSGRPRKLAESAWARARRWRAAGASDTEIAARLGVDRSTVSRRLAGTGVQERLPAPSGSWPRARDAAAAGEPQPEARQPRAGEPQAKDAAAAEEPQTRNGQQQPALPGPVPEPAPARGPAGLARIAAGEHASRYAGAMLLHAYWDRIGAADVLAAALPPGPARRRYDDLALLTATAAAFALGASSAEGTKHLIPGQAGIVAGIAALPELRTLRPRVAAIADGCDPLALQRQLAAAMLAADAPGLHVYYVDDHFVPYEGAKPVAKGWNTKRRHAQPGRADTMVSDYLGRAVCFAAGDPSGLAATLPGALAQLRQVTGEQAKVLFGFDRGGSYPVAFKAIRAQHADWVTWRRGKLAPVATAPRRYWAARGDGKPAEALHLADEAITIKDYGQARQITLFEDGAALLQVLTSDTTAPAAALLAWLRCRWRIENLFKYLEDNYGIHWLCDYDASMQDNDRLVANPERTAARARLKAAGEALAEAERALAALIADPELTAAAKNKAIPAAEKKITRAREAVTTAKAALKPIPAKLPANEVHPGAQKAVLRTRRRSLQMVLRLLAAAAEHWLATRLNDYLRDRDEYRAITRHLLHLGGQVTFDGAAITVTLDAPAPPRLARALAMLIDEINAAAPRMPGDQRPISYRLAAKPTRV